MKTPRPNLNLNTALASKWLAMEAARELGPDFWSIGGCVVVGILLTICLMVW